MIFSDKELDRIFERFDNMDYESDWFPSKEDVDLILSNLPKFKIFALWITEYCNPKTIEEKKLNKILIKALEN